MPEEYSYHVDENNKVIGRVTREERRKKNLRHRGSHFIVFNSKGEILITKRPKTRDIYPGLFEANQGGGSFYSETYEETARREIKEELGIKNPKLEFLFETRYEDDKNRAFIAVYRCVYNGKIKSQKEEIEDYFFVPVEKLKKMINENPEKFTPDSILIFNEYISMKRRS